MSDPIPTIESIVGMRPRTDHKPETDDAVTSRGPRRGQLVDATLELARQQRVANLIAWEALTGESSRAEVRKGLFS